MSSILGVDLDQLAEPSRLEDMAGRLAQGGAPVIWDDELAPRRRLFTADPWGNRIELIAAH